MGWTRYYLRVLPAQTCYVSGIPNAALHWAVFFWNSRHGSPMTTGWGQLHRNPRLTAASSFAYQLAALVPLPWSLSPADPEEICCSPWWYRQCLRTGHPYLPAAAGRSKEAMGGCWEASRGTTVAGSEDQSKTLTPPGAHCSWESCPSGLVVCKDFEML